MFFVGIATGGAVWYRGCEMIARKKERYAVILAGGRGERFWPVSRAATPKPFVSLFGGKPLLRHAVERLDGVVPSDHIFIVTMDGLAAQCTLTVPEIPPENIIDEPMGRDTAAACALGTELATHRAGKSAAAIAILTADQLITNVDAFQTTLRDSFTLAESEPVLVTMGIAPTSPATGYGYIEIVAATSPSPSKNNTVFHPVKRFVEKPDAPTAQTYLDNGRFLWNSGMFVWSADTFRAALAAHRPDLATAMNRIAETLGTPEFPDRLRQEYEKLEKISIDYAIMEKAKNLIVARGAFGWDDVGTWTAVERHFTPDAHGNVTLGTAATLDTRRSMIVSDPDHLVAVLGLDDIVVVHTKDATLVCPKSHADRLKSLLATLDPKYL